MRLHSLEITAFGPFADTVEVDLDRLSEAGLFLLTGPTGAGKTSVLDAVCFALYGDVPGDRSGAKRLRCDQAPPGRRPRVALEATLGGRRFRLVRSPQWERPKKRGTGHTTEQASVSLSEHVDGEWVPRTSRMDEAGQLVGDLLGMTLTQFTQVAVLPQGRFQTFLRARSEERHALLQKLFRTGRFEDVEAWLRERRVTLRRTSASHQQAAADLAGRLSEVAQVPWPECWEPDDLGAALEDGTLEEWCGELRSGADLALSHADRTARAAETTEVESRLAAEEARTEHERRQRVRGAVEEQRALDAVAASHADDVARLERARRAEPVLPLHRLAVEARESVRRAEASAQTIADRAGDLAHLETAPLLEVSESSRTAADRVEQQLPRAARARDLRRRADVLRGEAADLGLERERLSARLDDLPARTEQLRTRLAQARGEAATSASLASRREVVGAALRAHQEASDLARRLEVARADHLLVAQEALTARERLLDLRERRVASMAAELASGLAVGGGCPVCGSHEHPDKARPHDGSVGAEDERAAQQRLDDLAGTEHARAMHVRELETRRAAALERAGDHAVSELEAMAASLAAEHDAAQQAEQRLPGLEGEERALAEEASRLQARRAEVDSNLAAHETERRAALREAGDLEDELERVVAAGRRLLSGEPASDPGLDLQLDLTLPLEDEHTSPTAVVSALRSRAADAEALTEARRRSAEAAGRADDAEQAMAQALAEADLPDSDALLAAALSAADRQRLETRVESHRRRLASVAEVLAGAAPADVAAAADDTEQARHLEILERSERAHAGALAALSVAHGRERELRERARRVHDLADLAERESRAWLPVRRELALVTRVASLCEGKSEDNRWQMRLSAYVLAWRLSQVVAAANERLERMTDGRYALEHTGRRGVGERRGGLSLLVRDAWSGEARDPATLSGGETFVVSLALALGLADVIGAEAGGAPLDTLFVDEGFGSLDADTLEDVLDVLDSLREGGRVVGLVSHVGEMRDRIPVQLRVSKGRSGSGLAVVSGA